MNIFKTDLKQLIHQRNTEFIEKPINGNTADEDGDVNEDVDDDFDAQCETCLFLGHDYPCENCFEGEHYELSDYDGNCDDCKYQGDNKNHAPCIDCNRYDLYKSIQKNENDKGDCDFCRFYNISILKEPCKSCIVKEDTYSNYKPDDTLH